MWGLVGVPKAICVWRNHGFERPMAAPPSSIFPMTNYKWFPQFVGLVKDPEGKHYKKMGMAKWLFDYFCAEADRETGEWMGSLDKIVSETGLPLWSIKRYLHVLRNGNYLIAMRSRRGMIVKIRKFKTLVKNIVNDDEDMNLDERTPLEKNPKSKLYIADVEELQEYFKGVLKKAHLSNIDTYAVLQMYWEKIPFLIIKESVENVIKKSEGKNIFTLRYFKKAIYDSHNKRTHTLEPEEDLLPEDRKKKVAEFKKTAQSAVKEVKHEI